MRSKILFKCGISLNIISLMIILTFAIVIEAPILITCSPVILMVIGIIITVMGGKKVIVNENYIVFLEKKIPLNKISSVLVNYPLIEIKMNQPKNNRWLVDYNLNLMKSLEKYLDTNIIKYKNIIEIDKLPQDFFQNKTFKKDDVHSIFKTKNQMFIIFYNNKVYKFKKF
ncbi:MAG: hypothetical protein K2O05_00370 [Anaeroplasmataceae bacterium]|nr:hypothetical protein [Anaeroplasmataceae bacterium]